jgi:hypothetical protein
MLMLVAPLRPTEERELAARRLKAGTAPRPMAELLPAALLVAVLRPKPGTTLGAVNALA